jgi:hypothetical protein
MRTRSAFHGLLFLALALVGAVAGLSPAAHAESAGTQRFVVPLSHPGQPVKLEVSLIGGSISIRPSSGNEVSVEAVAADDDDHGDDRDEDRPSHGAAGMHRLPNRSLGLVVEEDSNHVTVGMSGIPREVTLQIRVPRQTSVQASTVNDGDLTVEGLEGTLELNNTNGSITAKDVMGSVVAHTTNGDVKVSMARVDANAPLAFATFNGDVDVTLPAATRGSLRMRSDNGEIYSDFDVQLQSQPANVEQHKSGSRYRLEVQQDLRGSINGGGPEIQLRTFNGDVYLHRK